MAGIKDDRGYNQGWTDSKSMQIRTERRCDYIISQISVAPSKKLMEIGCGIGRNSFMLAKKTGMDVLGTDLCRPFIESAQDNFQLPNLRYDVLDFNRAAEFKGDKFDYIVGNGILHHLYHNLDEALANISKLLKDDGKIIFLEPNIYNPYVYLIFSYPYLRTKAKLEPDEMAFSKGFIGEKLTNAGYRNVKVEYKDFLLPGVPEAAIKPSIVIGDLVERIPLLNKVAQSIFIQATKR